MPVQCMTTITETFGMPPPLGKQIRSLDGDRYLTTVQAIIIGLPNVSQCDLTIAAVENIAESIETRTLKQLGGLPLPQLIASRGQSS